MTSIAITGAAGRMGTRLVAIAKQSGTFQIVGAIERGDSPMLSRDAGEIAGVGAIGVPITSDLRATPQVLIDFTVPGYVVGRGPQRIVAVGPVCDGAFPELAPHLGGPCYRCQS